MEQASSNPLLQLEETGQSVWIDFLSRELLRSGRLRRLRDEDGIEGVTSNPAIFQTAIHGSPLYDGSLKEAITKGIHDAKELFLRLEIEDVSAAADLMWPKYQQSGGRDGYVSIETSPDLAYDVDATIKEVKRLAAAAGRRNVYVKVPATEKGPAAIERLVSGGININVTLLFSVHRYRQVAEAYMRGLERRQERGEGISDINSVASFFVSRVDTLVDKWQRYQVRGRADRAGDGQHHDRGHHRGVPRSRGGEGRYRGRSRRGCPGVRTAQSAGHQRRKHRRAAGVRGSQRFLGLLFHFAGRNQGQEGPHPG